MGKSRRSIAGLMGIVLVAALGLAGLHAASELWARVMFLFTCGVMGLAAVGVACDGKDQRAWRLGFAVFGWGYLYLAFWSSFQVPKLPTVGLLDGLLARVGVPLPDQRSGDPTNRFGEIAPPSSQIAHCLWSLLAATLGGALARVFFGPEADASDRSAAAPRAGPVLPKWRGWRRLPAMAVAGLLGIVAAAAVWSRSVPTLWTGWALIATWALIGLMVLGAACGQGRRRVRWLGAAVFGAGYMLLICGLDSDFPPSSRFQVDDSLRALFPWLPRVELGFPATSEEVAAANARIRKSLEQPVPMHFPHETPFEDVLKYIAGTTYPPDGYRLPIYLDPIGLKEAEKTVQSPVILDLDGVPLKTTLNLILRQLGLMYEIREGVLEISSTGCRDYPYFEDPRLTAGHFVLALLAAGLGAALAPLVAVRGRGTSA